jgi:two-component system phosphate regulon sensor histidine kinase PhoR
VFARLFLAFLALLVLTLAAIAFVSARTTRERVLEEIERRLESQAITLRLYVAASPEPESSQRAIRELGDDLGTRLTIIASDGGVSADSQGDPAKMDNHNSRPEVSQARSQGRGKNIRYSDTVHTEMMYHAVLLDPGRPNGIVIRSALPLTRIQEEAGAIYRGMFIAFLVIVLTGAAVTYLLSRWITRPLRQIQTVAQAIAGGDFDQKAPLEATGEIGDVARAINRMAEELAQRLHSLVSAAAKLEAVISGMQDAVIAVDRRGQVEHHNGAAKSMLDIRVDPADKKT